MTTYLTVCGSGRAGSLNQMTLDVFGSALTDLGGVVSALSLKSLEIPLYDGDLEAVAGLPQGVTQFQKQIDASDGLIFGCPEYNGYMTPLLLNALNWSTRSAEARPDLARFRDKPVSIVSASPGGFGGSRAATQLRTFLSGIGCLVLPDNLSFPAAMKVFNDDGKLIDENLGQRVQHVAGRFHDFTHRNS